MNEQAKKSDLRQGAILLVILVTVNVIEYWFALVVKSQFVLISAMALLAVIDSGLIMVYFMHILRLSEPEEGASH